MVFMSFGKNELVNLVGLCIVEKIYMFGKE